MQEHDDEVLCFSGGVSWTAEELASLLGDLYVLYNRIIVLNDNAARTAGGLIGQLYASKSRVSKDNKLKIVSLALQSPIRLNLKGLGPAIREMRELFKDLSWRNRLERDRFEEETAHQRAMNAEDERLKRIEVISRADSVAKRLGASKEERRHIIRSLVDPAKGAAQVMETKGVTMDEIRARRPRIENRTTK